MITIKKTGEAKYQVMFQKPVTFIDQHTGYLLKKEVGKIVFAHRYVSIDLNKIKLLDKNGYKMLEQLLDLAEKRNCLINFINIAPEIKSQIQNLKKVVE